LVVQESAFFSDAVESSLIVEKGFRLFVRSLQWSAYTLCMRRILFVTVVVSSLAPVVCAQDLLGKISCHAAGSEEPQNQPYTKKLWDGYEISLGPARNSQGGGDECTAAIYNRSGHVVFRTTGFGVIFDENHTGQDFDGDGKPEVVFITDTGGGNHCCWAYNVISLSPKPRKLFDIDAAGAVQFEKDSQGKMVIWQRTAGPYGFTSMARAPFAEKVLRVREGKLVDATPEFCPRIFSDGNEDYQAWKRNLTPEKIKTLQSTSTARGESEDIISDLLSRALQHVFCRQFDAALDDLDLWPEATRTKMKADFAESIKQDYPEFAARLISFGGIPSAETSSLAQAMDWLEDLNDHETLLATKLTEAEQKQIIDQVEKTSFDAPDSWESELRARRVSLGQSEGLLIRGTHLLCGGTGNCETWVFRRSRGDWLNLFDHEAPIVSGFGFEHEAAAGIRNLFVSANGSGSTEHRILFKFDGNFYRQSECYEVSGNGAAADKAKRVACK
jgi:hypothetical protein